PGRGFGRVRLDAGPTVSFDITVANDWASCTVGTRVVVELGPSRIPGQRRITRLRVLRDAGTANELRGNPVGHRRPPTLRFRSQDGTPRELLKELDERRARRDLLRLPCLTITYAPVESPGSAIPFTGAYRFTARAAGNFYEAFDQLLRFE